MKFAPRRKESIILKKKKAHGIGKLRLLQPKTQVPTSMEPPHSLLNPFFFFFFESSFSKVFFYYSYFTTNPSLILLYLLLLYYCIYWEAIFSQIYDGICRYAVLGAGFAGLSVAWHLLKVTQPLLLFLVCYVYISMNLESHVGDLGVEKTVPQFKFVLWTLLSSSFFPHPNRPM